MQPNSTRAVAMVLRQLLQDDGELFGLITVITGSQASVDPAPEARHLLALGASWDWVALQLGSHRFWDLHVGVLPAAGPLARFHVGLHWSTSVDQTVRPSTPATDTVPVVGATSASLHPHHGRPGGSYLLYRVGRENGDFVCELEERGPAKPGGPVETLSLRRLRG